MLARRGMSVQPAGPAGARAQPALVNPAASALAEDVYAGCCEDGSWWFWWSWAERIAAGATWMRAAARIEHVLALPTSPHGS